MTTARLIVYEDRPGERLSLSRRAIQLGAWSWLSWDRAAGTFSARATSWVFFGGRTLSLPLAHLTSLSLHASPEQVGGLVCLLSVRDHTDGEPRPLSISFSLEGLDLWEEALDLGLRAAQIIGLPWYCAQRRADGLALSFARAPQLPAGTHPLRSALQWREAPRLEHPADYASRTYHPPAPEPPPAREAPPRPLRADPPRPARRAKRPMATSLLGIPPAEVIEQLRREPAPEEALPDERRAPIAPEARRERHRTWFQRELHSGRPRPTGLRGPRGR